MPDLHEDVFLLLLDVLLHVLLVPCHPGSVITHGFRGCNLDQSVGNVVENYFTNIDLYPSVKVIREDNLSWIFLQSYSFNWCIFHVGLLTMLWFWFITFWLRFVGTLCAVGDFSNGAPFFLRYQGKFLERIIPWNDLFYARELIFIKVFRPNLAEYPRRFPSFPSWWFHCPPFVRNCWTHSIVRLPRPGGWSHQQTVSLAAGTWSPENKDTYRGCLNCFCHIIEDSK